MPNITAKQSSLKGNGGNGHRPPCCPVKSDYWFDRAGRLLDQCNNVHHCNRCALLEDCRSIWNKFCGREITTKHDYEWLIKEMTYLRLVGKCRP